ncbi:MAG: hypothetical protein FJ291_12560 [Planctomycetes bacterium]|nr:hypothetical protein [Planctomycetota bacterium]
MKYLGIAKRENGHLTLPDAFEAEVQGQRYEVVEAGGDILLLAAPLDRKRLQRIEELARRSIADHRRTLEGLAR